MVTPDKLRTKAKRVDALLEAFERSYLHIIDIGEDESAERERCTFAFYAIRDQILALVVDAGELCDHMDVCDAVLAIQRERMDKND